MEDIKMISFYQREIMQKMFTVKQNKYSTSLIIIVYSEFNYIVKCHNQQTSNSTNNNNINKFIQIH